MCKTVEVENESQVLLYRLWNLINSPMNHGRVWSTFAAPSIVNGVADLKRLMELNGFRFDKEPTNE